MSPSLPVCAAQDDPYAVRRWLTLGASSLASMCCGFFYAWSVLVKPMMGEYQWSAGELSLAFTFLAGTGALLTPLAGKLLQYMRPPTLVLIAGGVLSAGIVLMSFATNLGLLYVFAFIAGVGGLMYPGATMNNLMRFFPDRQGMASGVLTGGFGLGAVIWGPVAVTLIEEVGYKWTLRILGIFFLVVIVISSRLISVAPVGYVPRGGRHRAGDIPRDGRGRAEHATSLESLRGQDWKAMIKTLDFWLLFTVFFVGLVSGLMVTGHVSPIAQQTLGVSPEVAGAFVSYLAIGMVIGKIAWGLLSDRLGRSPVLITILALAVVGLLVLWQTGSYGPVVVGIFVVGLCYGGFLTLIGPVTLEAFGPRHFAINFGLMFWSLAFASFLGPRLAAAVVEANDGVYKEAFLLAAALTGLGLILAVFNTWLGRRKAATSIAPDHDPGP
jgi:OFA family oxalate/formate antiporter-like MFS transporter